MKARSRKINAQRRTWLLLAALAFSFQLSALGSPAEAEAQKKTWVFTLITPGTGVSAYETGNTTAATQSSLTTGVSAMARRYGPVTEELKRDPYTIDVSEGNGIFMARIRELAASQAASGATTPASATTGWNAAGTTSYFYVATAQKNQPGDWSAAEKVPVFLATAISGNTPMGRMFKAAPARYMRAWFLPSGVTPFDNAQIEITSGFGDAVYVPVYVVAEGSFSVVGGASGASTFTAGSIGAWPGGEYLEVLAGNSLFARADGTAPVTTGAAQCLSNVTISFDAHEARNVQFKSIATQTVYYRILNRRP
jgi:hypothetical protein